MARPRSNDKRDAIMAAAVRVIAAQGLGAPTALIAKEAGVSNGSLFTYFETKAELLNRLYLELKTEMAGAALQGMPVKNTTPKQQMLSIWTRWLRWTTAYPEKRRALAHLTVSGELTPETLQAGHQTMAGIAGLLEKTRANGPLRAAPLSFALALMNAMAEATIDFMVQDPAGADQHSLAGFDAVWRVLA